MFEFLNILLIPDIENTQGVNLARVLIDAVAERIRAESSRRGS